MLSLWRHRLRTSLTLLGLVFGVGAIVAMLGVGEGSRRAALRLVEARVSFADLTDGNGAVVGRVDLDAVVRTLALSTGETAGSNGPPARLAG